ncbi:hypothetical protein M0R45_004969 [Rubus argutus]|uniref:Uncharacterized protein n=1 Tax=Rubus argutus TaxID=59490 RepID=A0AAW1YLU8_RUBAR
MATSTSAMGTHPWTPRRCAAITMAELYLELQPCLPPVEPDTSPTWCRASLRRFLKPHRRHPSIKTGAVASAKDPGAPTVIIPIHNHHPPD